MTGQDKLLILLGVGGAAALVLLTTNRVSAAAHEWHRQVGEQAARGAALDNTLGMVTPDCYLWWGPKMRPPDWTPHRMRYTVAPGGEIERLIYGAPGSCVTPAVPKALRGWLFAPPSEVDY